MRAVIDTNVLVRVMLNPEGSVGPVTWAPSAIGIEGIIRWLTFSEDGTELVAAGDRGAFHSTDGGRTWQRVEGGPAAARAILLQRDGALHLGTNAGVVSAQGALSP